MANETIKTEVEGKQEDVTVLKYVASTYGAAVGAVGTYTKYFSDFTVEQKVIVKWANRAATSSVSTLITFIQEGDKFRAVTKVGGGYVGGIAGATLAEAVIALAAGLGATLSAPVVVGIGVTAGLGLGIASSESFTSLYDNTIKPLYDKYIADIEGIQINETPQGTTITTNDPIKLINDPDMKSILDNDNVTIQNDAGEIYTIEKGDTVWDIAQKNNTTVDELIKLNPWLKDNMSDDKSWILIKPGQTIELPQSDEQRSIDSGLEYNSQQAQQIIIDPLVLDLNHNGKIDTINANSSNTFFDMDNNGMSEITGWIDKEDGLLVYDKNNNGKIDNINELFGNKNKDGYSELRELINSNGDNVIDKNDTKFKDLKIWQDLNGDGISQSNELKTLDELNITSINLNSKNTNIDDNGNNIFKTSTFTQNGEEYLSADVELQKVA